MNNFKFFSIVLALIILSAAVLTGCMYAAATDLGDAKEYDMGSPISTSSNTASGGDDPYISGSDAPIGAGDDTPTPQEELQKKFSAMYDISEDEETGLKTITVISEEFLSNYWQSNYEKEVIHSLTTEEVYFIIQDSIRIYWEYDKVILAGFGPVSSDEQVAERFPFVDEQEVQRLRTSSLYLDKRTADIHTIIMYRLKALSSPKAFFTGADAIRFVGGEPGIYSSLYPEALFYIPGYSADTDRDHILSVMGLGGNKNVTDTEHFADLFMVSLADEPIIEFCPANGGTVEVFSRESIISFLGTICDEYLKDNTV